MPARRKPKSDCSSLRAFSRRVGVSLAAVQKAVSSGRLRESLARDGSIADVALAQREWAAGASKAANGGGRRVRAAVGARRAAVPPEDTLVQAQRRVASARADALEMANLVRRGELLEAATVQREQFEVARIVRERILNVPDRLAELDAAVRRRIRDELRQALGDIADELERE